MSVEAEQSPSGTAIRITEVGPRDGLQNEPPVPLVAKIAFIDALSRAGVTEIEAGAFVSPAAVPQMADSDDVFRKIARRPDVVYSALVPNLRGLDRALAAGVQKVSVFTAASETFAARNIHATIEESLARFKPVVIRAHEAGLRVRGYLSTVAFCPYEGRMAPERVVQVMRRLIDLGVDEVSLGETVGKASPTDMRRLLDHAMPAASGTGLSIHCHDTHGMAVANALTAWSEYGIQAFDASAGGLGGCPYAPGASGNVATEDLVYALKASGARVEADEIKVVEAAARVAPYLPHALRSRVSLVAQDPHPAGAEKG